MDCSISSNYQDIKFSFRLKFWEVSSAIHVSSGIEVSIWKFIYPEEKNQYSKDEIHTFLSKCRSSIIASQHLHHFNILRIFEVSDENDSLSFSSERILAPFFQEHNITSDEASYMISQLCQAVNYLHNEIHIAHFAISPDNIFFSPNFNLKLTNLLYFSKFTDYDSEVEPNLYPLNTSIFDIDPHFCSPEIKNHKNITAYSDVYSFGLFAIYAFTNQIPSQPLKSFSDLNIPEYLKSAVKKCLDSNPSKRPTFEQMLEVSSSNPVTVRVLNFIPKIDENTIESRQNFFKNLPNIISEYSPRLLTLKFIPTIVREMTDNQELSQQLLPLLLMIAEKVNPLDFYNLALLPLFKKEEYANYFVEKAILLTNASVFVPILIATCKSSFSSISSRTKELLKSANALENISSIIFMIGKLDDEEIIISILQFCENNIEANDSFLFIQQLKQLFKKYNTNESVLNSIASALLSVQPSSEYSQKAVSLSLLLIQSSIEKSYKEKLIAFIEKFMKCVRKSVETDSTELASISANSSANQILYLDEINVDSVLTDDATAAKKRERKKDRKFRRSSLANTSLMKKLSLDDTTNNSLLTNQKLFSLPKSIKPLSLLNLYAHEIDVFAFREYINAAKPPVEIRDVDPFDIKEDTNIKTNNPFASDTEKFPNMHLSDSKISKKNKLHKRSTSIQNIVNPNKNAKDLLDAKYHLSPMPLRKNSSSSSSSDNGEDDKEEDSSGPFKVSKKNTLFSASVTSILPPVKITKSNSGNLINFSSDEPFRSKAENPPVPDEKKRSKQKSKNSKSKRPNIPTPPVKHPKND